MSFNLDFLPLTAFVFLLIFARVGAMVMSLPGFGDANVPVRIRLMFALALTAVLYPLMQDRFPQIPGNLFGMLALFGRELLIGIALGMLVRMIVSGTQIAGTVIGFQVGLSAANSFDPNFGAQSNVISTFLAMLALVLIFTADLHHLLLRGVHDSYILFSPALELPLGDFAEMSLRIAEGAFSIGVQISAPFIVFGLVFYLGIGVLARLIPQIQIFFIAMPANIFIGLIMMMLLLSTMMMVYISYFRDSIAPFLAN